MRIQLATEGETGEPFVKWLHRVAGRDRAKRLVVFLQQWDHQADELGRAPTVREYAEEWRESESGTYRLLGELREVFPTEHDPSRIMNLLWDGIPRSGELMALLDVSVVEVGEH
ncbi:MAG: hypothetical protein WB507_01800 [Solirubrobacterales bacterium]